MLTYKIRYRKIRDVSYKSIRPFKLHKVTNYIYLNVMYCVCFTV